jgi:alpha-L-fucosidase
VVLVLNIAPDTTGWTPEPDVQRLKEFGEALKTLFTTNLITIPGVTVTPFEKMTDGTLRQEIQLATSLPVRYVVLQEDIRKGQRVERFEVEAIDTFGISRVMKATTIGWKRILKLEMPQVKLLEVTIRESRAEPLVTVAAY